MSTVLSAADPARYRASDEIIDADDPGVRELGSRLRESTPDDIDFARTAYQWVRDEIAHSGDSGSWRTTLTAGETLREGTGLCYAKSHLLAAVLRGQGIPAGLCYQRLRTESGRFVLHGLVAVFLDGAWHRQDPRGNRPGVDAQFSVAGERLAWQVRAGSGEYDYPQVFVTAAPEVVAALTGASRGQRPALPTALARSSTPTL
ncbi:transglutaminase family protein [Mycobacterium sp. ITM-2016-00317]|uniref:transglutaminase-like domain-containing protein n=1 Tax=Mycobacterium sp. ITM-2016-00317 TaxID=2099694 RepID=UPI00287FECF7|nr:transglutaminase family protein [Mycobacterium sp. ITM-2016-00317]WNG87518.1 transglutaminase family protein [Mycobacterium sp. ITM-2016-00317]